MSADAKKPARGGPWKGGMEQSARAKEFLRTLDPEGLKVGDGSNQLPVWIGIDAEAGKVYKVYACGLATGFGDGLMQLRSGAEQAQPKFVEQLTAGRHIMLSTAAEIGGRMFLIELDR